MFNSELEIELLEKSGIIVLVFVENISSSVVVTVDFVVVIKEVVVVSNLVVLVSPIVDVNCSLGTVPLVVESTGAEVEKVGGSVELTLLVENETSGPLLDVTVDGLVTAIIGVLVEANSELFV